MDKRVLAGEDSAQEIELVDEHGQRRVYWELKTPIYSDAQRKVIWGLCGISTEITARKLTEEELRRLAAIPRDALSPQDQVAYDVGFANAATLRHHFAQRLSTTQDRDDLRAIIHALTRGLKNRQIPVAGADRLMRDPRYWREREGLTLRPFAEIVERIVHLDRRPGRRTTTTA